MDPVLFGYLEGADSTIEETLGWHESNRDTVVNYLTRKAPCKLGGNSRMSRAIIVLAVIAAWCNLY